MTQKAMNEREQLRKALEDISAMTYDSWTNGARAKEIADAALSTPQADKVPAAEGASLPHPGSPEASAMMDSMLAEYQYPSNPKNAARAGYEAARRMLATTPAKLPQEEQPVAWIDAAELREMTQFSPDFEPTVSRRSTGGDVPLYAAPQPARAGTVEQKFSDANKEQFDAWEQSGEFRQRALGALWEQEEEIKRLRAAATTAATGEKEQS